MAITLGDAILMLSANPSALKKDLKQAEGETKSWAKSLGDVIKTGLGVALGNAISSGVSTVVGGLVGGFKDAVGAGLDFNNSIEQTTAKINAFTKDGAKTAEILEMIRKRAAATPFEFDAMSEAAAALIPSAKQAGTSLEDLIAQAEILGASNPAEGLEGAAFALKEAVSGDFTSIIERFNLPRQYINQLKEEGVPALEIVNRAMAQLGLDSSLVTNMAETASGRWSTFKDTLVTFAGTITQPIFQFFSDGLGKVNALLTQNEPLLTALSTSIATGVQQVMNGLTYILNNSVIPGLQNLFLNFGSGTGVLDGFFMFLNWQVIPALLRFSDWIFQSGIPGLFSFGTAVGTGLGSLKSFLSEVIAGFQSGGLSGAVDAALTQLQPSLNGLIESVNSFFLNAWPTIQTTLSGWADKFWGWILGDEKTPGAISKTSSAMTQLLTRIDNWAKDPETKKNLESIGKNIGTTLMDALDGLFKEQDRISRTIGDLLKAIRAAIETSHSILIEIGTALASGIVEGIITHFTGAEVSGQLKSGIGGAVRGAMTGLFPAGQLPSLGKNLGIPGFASGGMVPGAMGAPVLAMLHGGEKVLTPEQQRQGSPVGALVGAMEALTAALQRGQGGDSRQYSMTYNNTQPRSGILDLRTLEAMG